MRRVDTERGDGVVRPVGAMGIPCKLGFWPSWAGARGGCVSFLQQQCPQRMPCACPSAPHRVSTRAWARAALRVWLYYRTMLCCRKQLPAPAIQWRLECFLGAHQGVAMVRLLRQCCAAAVAAVWWLWTGVLVCDLLCPRLRTAWNCLGALKPCLWVGALACMPVEVGGRLKSAWLCVRRVGRWVHAVVHGQARACTAQNTSTVLQGAGVCATGAWTCTGLVMYYV